MHSAPSRWRDGKQVGSLMLAAGLARGVVKREV